MSGSTGAREHGGTGKTLPVPPCSRAPVLPSPTLVVQTAFLGDAILTLPLIIRLAEQWGPVDLVCTLAASSLLHTHDAIRQLFVFDKQGRDRGVNGLRTLAARLRQQHYARAVLPHRSLRSALLVRWAGIPERIGFGGRFPSRLYTRRLPWPATGHISDRLLSLSGTTASVPRPWLALTDEDRATVTARLRTLGITGPFTVLAPGSRWGTKRWPHYPALAAALDHPVVIIGDTGDEALGRAITAVLAPRQAYNLCGELTLGESAALIAASDRLITNDSAPLHLATALDHPVTAIFGPTVPAFGFGPIGPNGRIVEHPDMPCRPCSSHGPQVCPLGHHRCMVEIGVEMVLRAGARE